MSSTLPRAARRRALERRFTRLEQPVHKLQIASNRVSWLRAGLFIAGIAATLAAGTQFGALAGVVVFIVAMALFAFAVRYHHRLEYWLAAFKTWRDLQADQLARLSLDWDNIPNAPPVPLSHLALDLDLTGPRSLHQLLDTTISRQGSKRLAEWLEQTRPDLDAILARQRIVRELVTLPRFRARFWLTFRLVLQERLEGENLLEWLALEFHSRRLRWATPVAIALVAVNWILLALSAWAGWPPFWIISVAAYLAFFYFNFEYLNTVLGALVRLDAELGRFGAILRFLEAYRYTGHPELERLCAPLCNPRRSPSGRIRQIKWATLGVGLRSNPFVGLLLNLALPWDFVFALIGDYFRTQVTQDLPVWVRVCYELDALIAVANFAGLNPEYTFPELSPAARPVLEATALGHPLIPFEQNVRNDFAVAGLGELAIITGSNMAGKSTFLKTVGANLCLAYAGAPVMATRFRAAPLRIHTCIRISDSIVDGFSYFYAEVKCLKQLLDELRANDPLPLLYLIDEIFRGTNNRERLLGSRAYVRALFGANGIGLMATHDLELASLAKTTPNAAHNYHFRDQVQDSKLVFDYHIHPGPSPTTNALKIMQLEGLPVDPADLQP